MNLNKILTETTLEFLGLVWFVATFLLQFLHIHFFLPVKWLPYIGLAMIVGGLMWDKFNLKKHVNDLENKTPSIEVSTKVIQRENPFDKPNSQAVLVINNTGSEAVFNARAKNKDDSVFHDLAWDDGVITEIKINHGDNTHLINLGFLGFIDSKAYINLPQTSPLHEGERQIVSVPYFNRQKIELEVVITASPQLREPFHQFYDI